MATGRPAASTAGNLSGRNVPTALGSFTPTTAEPEDGEFVPNGTSLHALDARYAAVEALPDCSSTEVQVPTAIHALAASYARSGDPGSVVVLEFTTADQARSWFTAFTSLVRQCPRVGIAPVITASTVTDRRSTGGSVWTEAGFLHDNRATMAAVHSSTQDPQVLLATVRDLR